jgi:hypothetical protein
MPTRSTTCGSDQAAWQEAKNGNLAGIGNLDMVPRASKVPFRVHKMGCAAR